MEETKKQNPIPAQKAIAESPEEIENESKAYDMVLVVVNKGYTDLVMQASRKAGARGGTIMTARGTGNSEIGKFYGIAIQPEKEIVMILTERTKTDLVLKTIYEEAGLGTNGQGIAFAIPAGQTAGLTARVVKTDEDKKAA